MDETRDNLRYWADLGDNRVGPLMRELADAIADTDDADTLYRLHRRLMSMANIAGQMSRKRG